MAENRRHRDKRFYFSRGQLVLLGGAFALSALVIFLLGIIVGRGVEERKMAKPEEPLIKIPVKPSSQSGAPASGKQVKEELTFYNTLAKRSDTEPQELEKSIQARATVSPPIEKNSTGADTPSAVPMSNSADSRETGNTWHVQVNAFPDERSGKIWVDRLKSKGYKAYLTEARNKGKVWYRVRVGQFSSREEAEKMVDILKTRENFAKAFATRQ